jgi:hypothetical protein
VHAPTLNLVPLGGSGDVKLLNIVNSALLPQPVGEQHPRKFPSSSTGWVNFAKLAEYYSYGSKRGDSLLIRHRETWFPVHRFFVLAIGLRGRYGHRSDHGEARSVKTVARLFTEEGNRDDEDAYLNSPTANKLYGTTGVIWWRQSLDLTETRFDEIYFAQHPDRPRSEDLSDPTPLSELFWLSIGCLPMGDGSRVFDLDRSNRAPVISTRNNTGAHQISEVHFSKRESLLTRHKEWAISMGAGEEEVSCLEFPSGMTTTGQQPRIRTSDLRDIAHGILKLKLSAGGFLLPAKRNLSSFFPASRFRTVLADPINYANLRGINLDLDLAPTLERLADHLKLKVVNSFSRQWAELCFQVDSLLQTTLIDQVVPKTLQDVIGILTIVDNLFIAQTFPLSVEEHQDTISITTQADKAVVRGHVYQLNSALILPNANTDPDPNQQFQTLHILLCCLKACIRMVAVNNFVDSTPLLDCVNKMTATVHVASNTYPPMLYSPGSQASQGQPQKRWKTRIREEGESSETDGERGITWSDSSDNDDDASQGQPQKRRKTRIRRERESSRTDDNPSQDQPQTRQQTQIREEGESSSIDDNPSQDESQIKRQTRKRREGESFRIDDYFSQEQSRIGQQFGGIRREGESSETDDDPSQGQSQMRRRIREEGESSETDGERGVTYSTSSDNDDDAEG